MTPAEHYAEAERILAEVNEHAEKMDTQLMAIVDPESPSTMEAVRIAAKMTELGLAEAQVHATLATIDKNVLWPKEYVLQKPIVGMVAAVDTNKCTCPRLETMPLARTSIDADCPVHGRTLGERWDTT